MKLLCAAPHESGSGPKRTKAPTTEISAFTSRADQRHGWFECRFLTLSGLRSQQRRCRLFP
jgi:hypothetical protein